MRRFARQATNVHHDDDDGGLLSWACMMQTSAHLPPFLASALQNGRGDDRGVESASDASASSSKIELATFAAPLSQAGDASSVMAADATDPQAPTQAYKIPVKPSKSAYALEDDEQTDVPLLLVPPLNFDMVCAESSRHASNGRRTGGSSGGALYRSGFPNERNYPFLDTLKLRSIMYLAADDVRPNLQNYIDESRGQTRLLHFPLNVNKEPFAESGLSRCIRLAAWPTDTALLRPLQWTEVSWRKHCQPYSINAIGRC